LPQHKSCKKRMRTSAEERARNRALRSHMAKSIKTLENCSTKEEADKIINDVFSIIDKAAQKNVIHENKAARDKSKLMAFYHGLSK